MPAASPPSSDPPSRRGAARSGRISWFALYAIILLRTRPSPITPVAPTQDFGGDEPPAVVSLLTHGWKHTDAAARATLLDLAARRRLELRQPAADPRLTTIHLPSRNGHGDAVLNHYERRVLGRVQGLVTDGMVPLTALTFRDSGEARAWSRHLKAEVLADARQRGLSRRRFSAQVSSVLALAALAATAAVLAATVHYDHRTHPQESPVVDATVVTFLVLRVLSTVSRGERDTPAGRAAAERWLGLRDFLRGDEAFAQLPPAAVVAWDRYLAVVDRGEPPARRPASP